MRIKIIVNPENGSNVVKIVSTPHDFQLRLLCRTGNATENGCNKTTGQ